MPLTRAVQYDNYASTVLAADVLVAQTTIEVADPSVLPSLGAGEWFYLVLRTPEAFVREIVRVTGVTGAILTVDRGVDDTTALDFDSGDPVEVWFVKIILDDIRADFNSGIASIEADIDATDVIIADNQIKIGEIETQSGINARAADLNTNSITDLGEDITDLIFSDMTDVTLAGSAAFVAAQGVGASAANPMIKISDIPIDVIGITHYRERLLMDDFVDTAPLFNASTTVTGLVDGDYILMGTWALGIVNDTVARNAEFIFDVTVNTPGPVNKRLRDDQRGGIDEGVYRQFMVPFTISGSTSVTVDFLIDSGDVIFAFNILFVDLFAVRVG